jgi:hypothetical protein
MIVCGREREVENGERGELGARGCLAYERKERN